MKHEFMNTMNENECTVSTLVCATYRFLPTVNLNRNSHDPRNPPRIVFSGVAANHALLNCISDNTINAKTDDNTAETGVETAGRMRRKRKKTLKNGSSNLKYALFVLLN